MIDFNFTKDCCGCRACGDVCPTHCIEFTTNQYGWVIPTVDTDRCINCHLCEKKCPFLSYKRPSERHPILFSAFAKDFDIREKGSSGSIFFLLAKHIIDQGGVVFGAAFDQDLQLHHTKAESIEDLLPLMKSKYLQSNTEGIYVDVLDELKKGRKVMFVGTPCQIVALNNILGKRFQEQIVLVDFICHGVPGQQLFNKCIESYQTRTNSKITSFNFRKKTEKSLRSYQLERINLADSSPEIEVGNSAEFPYYYGYLKYFTFRDACYSCKYLGQERVSDLTLGDFWFLETLRPITDFNKGYSMIIINSPKGNEIFSELKDSNTIECEEFPIETAVKLNPAYTKPTTKSIVHHLFKRDYATKPFTMVEKRYLQAKLPFIKKCIRYIIVKTGI